MNQFILREILVKRHIGRLAFTSTSPHQRYTVPQLPQLMLSIVPLALKVEGMLG